MSTPRRSIEVHDTEGIMESFRGDRLYQGAHANDINDLDSCCADIEAALEALTFMQEADNPRIKAFMWEQALVSYGRCFATGVRHTVRPEKFVKLLPAKLRQHHTFFKALRNQYATHSVNGLEMPMIVYRLSTSGEASITTTNVRMTPSTDELPGQLRELSEALLHLMRERQRRLVELAKTEIEAVPLAERFAVPELGFDVVETMTMEARKRYGKLPKQD